jgi:hypothetical protein
MSVMEPTPLPPAQTIPTEKEQRRLLGEGRNLDAWERYRALNDSLDEAYELTGIANREARFALLMLGGLNAGLFIISTRPEIVSALPPSVRWVCALLLLGYGAVAVYCVIQAIEALKPRKFRSVLADARYRPAGLRYYEDILERNPEDHWRAWQDVKLGELVADLVAQSHSLSRKNAAKYLALRRLYGGLQVLVSLAAVFVTLAALVAFF